MAWGEELEGSEFIPGALCELGAGDSASLQLTSWPWAEQRGCGCSPPRGPSGGGQREGWLSWREEPASTWPGRH